jgi:cAMP phosphodiesterase
MRLRVLGCSGGIGAGLRTTTLLLDDDVLIDAGTGVGDLEIAEMAKIDHIFVTHSHLDHVTSIPFIADTVGWMRDRPITIHALPETIEILKKHLFNWKLWPDFAEIPDEKNPVLRYSPLSLGESVTLNGRTIRPVPANHVVPAVGYWLDSGRASLVFTGDTTCNDALWREVNRIENLRYLIIETAFCNREKELAIVSKHLCPSMLAGELDRLERVAEVFVTHLKPGEIEITMREIAEFAGKWNPQMLDNKHVFEF